MAYVQGRINKHCFSTDTKKQFKMFFKSAEVFVFIQVNQSFFSLVLYYLTVLIQSLHLFAGELEEKFWEISWTSSLVNSLFLVLAFKLYCSRISESRQDFQIFAIKCRNRLHVNYSLHVTTIYKLNYPLKIHNFSSVRRV